MNLIARLLLAHADREQARLRDRAIRAEIALAATSRDYEALIADQREAQRRVESELDICCQERMALLVDADKRSGEPLARKK